MSFLIDFCLPALVLSGAALVALAFVRESSVGFRTTLAIIGLLAWVLPWNLLTLPVFAPQTLPLAQWIETTALALEYDTGLASGPATPADPGALADRWWLLLFLPGALLFLRDLRRHHRRLRNLERQSRDGEHLRSLLPESMQRVPDAIRIIPGSNAMATGVLRGTIWMGERLCSHREIEAALVHECCHLRRRDVVSILAVNLARRLYCWNPLVLALSRNLQLLIEQACDADSAAVLGRTAYRRSLARLVLDSSANGQALVPMILGGSDDYRRIRALGSGPSSVLRCCNALGLVVAASFLALGVNARQPDPRLGEWRQERASSNYLGLYRIFEDLGSGATRTHIAANLHVENQLFLDHRCDGSFYPVVNHAGVPTDVTISCAITDANTVNSKSIRYLDDSPATFGYWQGPEESAITETISADGRRYTVATERLNRNGRVMQTLEQTFARVD